MPTSQYAIGPASTDRPEWRAARTRTAEEENALQALVYARFGYLAHPGQSISAFLIAGLAR